MVAGCACFFHPDRGYGIRSSVACRTDRRATAPRSRVLIADDNADMRDYLRRLLAEAYEVETVADGEAALRSLTDHAPDLVLADVMMPGLDGFRLLQAIRGNATISTLPVILLSARAGEESRVEGLQAGADDYIVKPFSARELLARDFFTPGNRSASKACC